MEVNGKELWFSGENDFLSNFYPCPVEYNGVIYPCNECAFQAQKTFDLEMRKTFTTIKPSSAKAKGKQLLLRPDWEDKKFKIMEEICRNKFNQNQNLKEMLINTGNLELQERRRRFPDKIWGMNTKGEGNNELGKILMKIREELKK